MVSESILGADRDRPDVEALMVKVKATVAERIRQGVYSAEEIEAVRSMELEIKEKRDFGLDMDSYMAYFHANWNPTGSMAITSHRPVIGPGIVFVKKILWKLARPFAFLTLMKQSEFNAKLTQLLTAVLPSLRDNQEGLEKRFEELILRHYELLQQNRDLHRRLDGLAADLSRQEALLARMPRQLPRTPADKRSPAAQAAPAPTPAQDWYLSFEDRHRGSSRDISEKQRQYLPFFRDRSPVLDAGCGRGEFLELLRESGVEAYGIDLSAEMVELCRQKGLKAQVGDVLDHLGSIKGGGLGGIFAAQLVEHLHADQLLSFIRLSAAALAPGGRLLVETINPACLAAFAGALYLDWTHTRPLHPEGLRFLLQAAGFATVEIIPRSPFPVEMKLKEVDLFHRLQRFETSLLNVLNDNFNQLNELIYGYQDYAAVATKPA